MSRLTSHLLNTFPYQLYADTQTIKRGQAYYNDNRVWDILLVGTNRAICTVDGDSGEYTVEIEFIKKRNSLAFSCDCPNAENHFCKHMVAAGMELGDFLTRKDETEYNFDDLQDAGKTSISAERPLQVMAPQKSHWRQKIDNAILQVPSRSQAGSKVQQYAAVFLMAKQDYFYSTTYSFTPFIIKSKYWEAVQNLSTTDPQAINDLLEQNYDWVMYGEDLNSHINPAGCNNLSPEAFSLMLLFAQNSHLYNIKTFVASYLPMLAKHDIPVFLATKDRQKITGRIQIHPEPGKAEVQFFYKNGDLILEPRIHNEVIKTQPDSMELLSENPAWLLSGNRLMRLSDINQMNLLKSLFITVPENEIEFFRQNYLHKIAQNIPIHGEMVNWQEINAQPKPRLYLYDDKDNILYADLYFGYADSEVRASKADESYSIDVVPNSWNLLKIHRQPELEENYYQILADPQYLLKRADATRPYGSFVLRSRTHPFDFLIHAVPKLAKAGFEVFGEENLKAGKINRSAPKLNVSFSSGIDWFDLKTIVEFGDQKISFHDVRKAIKRGEHYIKLADGSIGQIPENWLEKFKHLWNLAQETDDGFRLNDQHVSLLDSLLDEENNIQIPRELQLRRERLGSFEQIHSHPLPEGFTGQLRPYQKHGFDWLHFLHEYRFGGILADDMGLGKTIQILAYLQSIKEKHGKKPGTGPASLLVVPKSLIINWQRESEKFTSGLTFYEYIGNIRSKNPAIFNDYDIVLTTYGTMLRDYDFLRTYTFDHIILDESQSIKNPLSKSAKAARLLNAQHRLVMTGTPVENNTFELWSQFAFLNPGLLGSMEYFKKEFAGPIESRQDEAAVNTLKQLVYPFILRRTKAQVAPELPPRTDRILFTDMEPAQKKLYTQTRERYRSELLGLVENEGMEQARFKILEGLLRLRQIAIHPALVDKSYHGDAPKFEILQETLQTLLAEGHKALIFSQFVETLHLVRAQLEENNIKYVYLDGQTTDRQAQVDFFQNDASIPFFLISLKAGGVGLNLTAADYVIHLDPWWNPAVEMQATDRAHRIGQQNPVFVYKIIVRETVEEKILLLQEKKRDLVNNLIGSETSFFKSLTREDVKMLFE